MQAEQSMSRADEMLAQAGIILPSQYFGSIGTVGLSGEQRLMLAVLVDAINVLQSWKGAGSAHKRRNFAEAVQWVNTGGTSHPFSFDSVCDALEIESELLRSRLSGLTLRPANSTRRLSLARLRLKQLSRSQRVTANRSRRRNRVSRTMTAITGRTSERTSCPEVYAGRTEDCTTEVSAGSATIDERAADSIAAQGLSY